MNISRTNSETMGRSDWIWLLCILSVAATLRMIKLDSSLWFDEIATLVEFVRLPVGQLVSTLTALNNHLLYSLEAKAAIAIFGESAWALRFPAMLFGVASVAALWFVARRLTTAGEANMAALLMAVSYHHIWFSQNARGYTGLMFWALIGAGLFVRGMSESSWRTWIAYACVMAAAGYTHLSAVFFFGVQGLLFAVVAGRRLWSGQRISDFKPVAGFALGLVLVLLLHVPILPQLYQNITISAPSSSQGAVPEWKNPLWTLLEVIRNLQGLGVMATVGLPVALVLIAGGCFSLARRHSLFVAAFVIHIPLTLAFLILLSFRIWPRYFFIDLGFIFLCLVHGVYVAAGYIAKTAAVLRKRGVTGETLGLAASTAAVFCSLLLLGPNYRYPKQDFLGARDFVERGRAPQEGVITIGLASYAFSKYYAPQWQTAGSWQEIEQLRRNSPRIWLVYTSELEIAANNPDVLKGVKSDFELMARLPGTLGDGAVYVYRSRLVDDPKPSF